MKDLFCHVHDNVLLLSVWLARIAFISFYICIFVWCLSGRLNLLFSMMHVILRFIFISWRFITTLLYFILSGIYYISFY